VRGRTQRRVWQAAGVASVLSGAPSTALAIRSGGIGEALAGGLEATRIIGTLVPPGRPGLLRGAVVHLAISVAVAELLGALLPRERSVAWGLAAGLGVGWVNLAVIAPRRFPAIAALPLASQLADNAAFGAVFAAVADR
jgi:hypothetical protein